MEKIRELSLKYDVPEEDILLISLNMNGLHLKSQFKRVRFKFKLNSKPNDKFYLGIPVLNASETPFGIDAQEKVLTFNNEPIGTIEDVENDTCDTSYFRRGDTALTLNSNSRSTCYGCAFCATHRQDATDKTPITNPMQLEEFMSNNFFDPSQLAKIRPHFHKESNTREFDFSSLFQLAIVTGCFYSEEKAINHINMIYDYFHEHGFKGELRYIGSEITSEEGLKELSKIENLVLVLSLECFTRRDKLLKNIKAKLTLEKAKEVLATAKKMGIQTSFTYISGLDPLSVAEEGLKEFSTLITQFPTIQVFQPHWAKHEQLRIQEANDIEYYLKLRAAVEKMFYNTNMRPRAWENYRPLWYFKFANEKHDGIRI